MTKKKEEKTEEVPEETPKKTSPNGKSKEEKKTLLELVKSSNKSDTLIIMESYDVFLTKHIPHYFLVKIVAGINERRKCSHRLGYMSIQI